MDLVDFNILICVILRKIFKKSGGHGVTWLTGALLPRLYRMYQLMLSQYALQREQRQTRTRINLCKYSYLTRCCVTTTEVDLGRDVESN